MTIEEIEKKYEELNITDSDKVKAKHIFDLQIKHLTEEADKLFQNSNHNVKTWFYRLRYEYRFGLLCPPIID